MGNDEEYTNWCTWLAQAMERPASPRAHRLRANSIEEEWVDVQVDEYSTSSISGDLKNAVRSESITDTVKSGESLKISKRMSFAGDTVEDKQDSAVGSRRDSICQDSESEGAASALNEHTPLGSELDDSGEDELLWRCARRRAGHTPQDSFAAHHHCFANVVAAVKSPDWHLCLSVSTRISRWQQWVSEQEWNDCVKEASR